MQPSELVREPDCKGCGPRGSSSSRRESSAKWCAALCRCGAYLTISAIVSVSENYHSKAMAA